VLKTGGREEGVVRREKQKQIKPEVYRQVTAVSEPRTFSARKEDRGEKG